MDDGSRKALTPRPVDKSTKTDYSQQRLKEPIKRSLVDNSDKVTIKQDDPGGSISDHDDLVPIRYGNDARRSTGSEPEHLDVWCKN